MNYLRKVSLFILLASFSLVALPQAGASATNGYVVSLKPGVNSSQVLQQFNIDPKLIYTSALNGFTFTGSPEIAKELASDPRVSSVEVNAPVEASAVQVDPGWGLDRIDSRTGLDNLFSYNVISPAVQVYVIDSGISTFHPEFGGRASTGIDTWGDADKYGGDCTGHGTSVASLIGGKYSGVAKNANLISVRVFGCSSTTYLGNIIQGIDWVTANAVKPAVVNMSLSATTFSTTLNSAVQRAIDSGLTFTVAAGNSSADACLSSPSSVPGALTVGGSNSSDVKASWSNYGNCVDLYAPGVSVRSASILSSGYHYATGTSFSVGYVAGIAAQYLVEHRTATPAQVHDYVLSVTTPGVVTGLAPGMPNRLAYSPHKKEASFVFDVRPEPLSPLDQLVLGFKLVTSQEDYGKTVAVNLSFKALNTSTYLPVYKSNVRIGWNHKILGLKQKMSGTWMVYYPGSDTVTNASAFDYVAMK